MLKWIYVENIPAPHFSRHAGGTAIPKITKLVYNAKEVTKISERNALNLEQLPFVHKYQRLAEQGFVPPLTHVCGERYTIRVKDDRVKFQCFACGTMTDPGLADTKAMEARIEDYKAKRK